MDNGVQDTSAKNVFSLNDDNMAKRDFEYEENEKKMEIKNKTNYDPLEDI